MLPQSSYAYVGHFARFVQPGARRVLCAATQEVLECTAFANPDGTVATVVMNRSDKEQPSVLDVGGRRARLTLPPRAIATVID